MSEVSTVQVGDRKVARRVIVNASAAEIFALVADPRRHGELDGSGTVRDTVDGPAKLSAGATFSVKMKQFGVPYKIASRVVDYAEGSVIAWRHPLGHTWIWQLTELSPGRTQVTETFDYTSAKAPKLLEIFGMPNKNAQGITKTLDALAARFG